MVTITNDLGTFTGETEKAALREVAKAKRLAAKQQAIADENRQAALRNAEAIGYRYLYAVATGESMPAHSWIVRPGQRHWPVRIDPDNLRASRVAIGDGATIELYSYRAVALLLAPSGDVRLMWTQDMDRPDSPLVCLACGHHAGQSATAYMPESINPELFETA